MHVNLKERFRTVVAMWIFIGLLGGPMMIGVGVSILAGAGPWAPHQRLSVSTQTTPGQELKIRGRDSADLRPGEFMVLAQPADVDPADVTCSWKSRVYTTGEQRAGTLEHSPVQGYAPVVTDPTTGAEYRTVTTTARGTGWMEIDFLTCTGPGVTTFALAPDAGMSDSARPLFGALAIAFALLATALGYGALRLTQRWRRQDAAARGTR